MNRSFVLVCAVLAGCLTPYTVPAADEGGLDTGGTTEHVDTCADDLMLCGSICVDVSASANHCGSCGNACAPADVCDLGECVDECAGGRVPCSGACVDLTSDPRHCGVCGETCNVDGACVAGDCIDACGDACHDEREICVGGTCECRSGFDRCGGTCVDLGNDPAHCGECDRDCGSDPCGDGECQSAGCVEFPVQCGGSCTDLQSDPLHCSECDRACDGDETCELGECEDQSADDAGAGS